MPTRIHDGKSRLANAVGGRGGCTGGAVCAVAIVAVEKSKMMQTRRAPRILMCRVMSNTNAIRVFVKTFEKPDNYR
jgi:hypothetical protein